jgi:hypothetical protein
MKCEGNDKLFLKEQYFDMPLRRVLLTKGVDSFTKIEMVDGYRV